MIRTHFGQHGDDCFGCHVQSIQFGRPAFQPHFNFSVGQHVSSESEMREILRKQSDDQSERTGIAHNYEYITPSDLRTAPPPVSAPSHLDRLVAHDERGRAMHAPVDDDPTLSSTRESRERQYHAEKEDATVAAETQDLISQAPQVDDNA